MASLTDHRNPALDPEKAPSASGDKLDKSEGSDRSASSPEPPIPQDPDTKDAPLPKGPDVDAFPDGGFQAWLVVAGGFAAVFASFGWINCIGVFQDYYSFHQLENYSQSTISWIPSTESFMMFFCGPIAGKIVDNFGPRFPLALGTFLHIFGIMMTSISKEYYQFFLAQAVCSAIGTSFLFYSSIAALGTWFKKRRALAFGIITAGSSLGGVILPIMVDRLIPQLGFGWAMRTVAFMLFGLLIFANLALRSRLPPRPKPFNLKEFAVPFKDLTFLLLAIAAFLVYFGAFLPFTYIIVQGKAQGMSNHLAAYLIPIVNAASTPGRIIPGYLGDKYGVFNMFIIFTVVAGILDLALWLPGHSNAALITFAALYGFASGTCLSILPAVVATISDIRELGTRTGTLYACSSFGALTGSPIAGAIIAHQHGSFDGLKIYAGICLLAGATFAIFSRSIKVGFSFKAKM